MPETTLLIKAALNLRVGAVFDVYEIPERSSNYFLSNTRKFNELVSTGQKRIFLRNYGKRC